MKDIRMNRGNNFAVENDITKDLEYELGIFAKMMRLKLTENEITLET